jgi:hypothetical protein
MMMSTEENISRREKKPQGLFSNPVPWVGAIASISVFAITASFNWALSVQEKLVDQDSRIKALELSYLEFKSDIKDIKENVIFLRVNTLSRNPINPPEYRSTK